MSNFGKPAVGFSVRFVPLCNGRLTDDIVGNLCRALSDAIRDDLMGISKAVIGLRGHRLDQKERDERIMYIRDCKQFMTRRRYRKKSKQRRLCWRLEHLSRTAQASNKETK